MSGLTAVNAYHQLIAFGLEELEERIAPAGAVTVAVHGGNLVITGDNLGNQILIDQDGLDAGQVRISSLSLWGDSSDVTAINGSDVPIVISGVTGGIVANLRDGNDVLGVGYMDITSGDVAAGSRTVISGDLSVNMGNGDDWLLVLPGIDVLGNLSMSLGGGWDLVLLLGDDTVHGNFTVKGADGNDAVSCLNDINDPPLEGITVHGSTVIADTGGDTDIFLDGTFFGAVTVKTGGFTPWDHSVANPPGQELSLEGLFHQNVTVTRGGGSNETDIDKAVFEGNVSIRDGSGPHSYSILESSVRGNLSIRAGAGYGELALNAPWWASDEEATAPFDVAGSFSYITGGGEQTVQIANGAIHGSCLIGLADGCSSVTISDVAVGAHGVVDNDGIAGMGDLVVRLGAGASGDDVTLTGVDVAGSAVLNSGYSYLSCAISHFNVGGSFGARMGDRGVELSIDHAAIGGPTSISSGAGEDVVSIDNTEFANGVSINTGRGDDEIWIQSGADKDLSAPSVFHGPLTIAAGAGCDIISIGGAYGISSRPDVDPGPFRYVEVFGPVTVLGGLGSDQLRMVGVRNVFHDAFHLSGIETIS